MRSSNYRHVIRSYQMFSSRQSFYQSFYLIFFCSVEGCGKKGSGITLFKIPFENDTYTERGHRKTMSMGKLCGFVEEVDKGLSLPSTFHRRRLRKTLRYAGNDRRKGLFCRNSPILHAEKNNNKRQKQNKTSVSDKVNVSNH